MDPRRLSAGEWIAGISGLALLVSLFLPWYTLGGNHVTAWQAMTVDDVLLALAGVAAVTGVVATARRTPAVPVAYTVLAGLAGLIATVLTAWRLADPAPAVAVGLGAGAWLGLAASLAIAGGAWAGTHDEGRARRSPSAERAAASAGIERAELLTLPPDGGPAA